MAYVRAQSARGRGHQRATSIAKHQERLDDLRRLADRIDGLQATANGPWFAPPRPIRPTRQRERWLYPSSTVQDVVWPSDYHAFLPEADQRYRKHRDNLQGAARLWLHSKPGPVAVLVHGYMGGTYRLEERAWPVRWLHGLGLDVALFVLPWHGVRAIRGRRRPPPFPSRDPRITNEGLRHAIGDLRDLTGWLHDRGHPSVGVMGMSLGAYTAALAATVMPELAFAVPIIPLASLADFARAQGRFDSDPAEASSEHQALDRVHRIVSPLHRSPVLPGERMMVIAGRSDQVTPLTHAERLAAHFGAPMISWPGGHLIQLGRMACFRAARELLTKLAVLPEEASSP